MPYICYRDKKFTKDHLRVIEHAVAICNEYEAQGLVLTLRALHYQFVSRDLYANTQQNYNRLGSICNDARMAGKMDWNHLIDRTRDFTTRQHFKSPAELIRRATDSYHKDLWAPQHKRIEVWVEKDAAVSNIERVCRENDVGYFSARGYSSASAMWENAQRVADHIHRGEQVVILHVGDHDPSGLDMTRDMDERMKIFLTRDWLAEYPDMPRPVTVGNIKASMREHMRRKGNPIEDHVSPWRLKRIALTLDQVRQYNPPPNFAKQTDSRFHRYMAETGLTDSWELDALDPAVLQNLIIDEVEALRDEDTWADSIEEMEHERQLLVRVGENWDDVARRFTDES